MASTKEALGTALKQMIAVKPIEKITIKDLVTICGVNRQTFYYHFDDVYDLLEWVFEEDANRVLPKEVVYEHWRDDVMKFFDYLRDNSAFALRVYNSNTRTYMLRFYKQKLRACIESFAVIASQGMNIDHTDFEFAVEFYSNAVIGLISQWLDNGMVLPPEITRERFLKALDMSVEALLERFTKQD